ncbi:MAG: tRNA (adenosine(37)-N6)-dimethylallyltransferase MiaA [Candidatus Izimaplasma sp.]|nr:tRNA (adenosine(37)-N6)-dimethylallyltransferase MiaA [Candidatus Izimaplasma bacterium]
MDLLVIVGPTGVGKTQLSIVLAKEFNGEIISGDAMQFYKGMDIGTAKATKTQRDSVKHHLLDILEPNETFTVVDYQKMVREKIDNIKAKNKLPILVGGSGLYIQSIIYNYKFKGNKSKQKDELNNLSLTDLQNQLKKHNPLLYEKIDLENKRRVIRALEKTDDDIQKQVKPYYNDSLVIGLNTERNKLYERINNRVDLMIKNGLLEEVKTLYDKKINSQSVQAIGYKEFYLYFSGEITLEEAIRLVKRNSRRYAKRQLTWFRNKMNVNWFESDFTDFELTIQDVKKFIKKRS